jgi:tetratricopeptide (TPR) repeat protein
MKGESTPYNLHQYYKHIIINKYNGAPADKKDGMRDFIIDEYMKLSDYVESGAARKRGEGKEDEAKEYDAEQDFFDKYFLQIVKDCETLTTVVEKKIVSLPQNKDEKTAKVKSYIDLLDKKKCQATPTYGKLMDTLITIDPTADAYYITGKFYSSQEQDSKAIEYFEKAVQLEDSAALKNKYQYELAAAQYKSGRYKAAFGTAKGVEGEYRGRAMVICGNAIAATANDCGDSTFDRKANFWLANDYYRKAAAAGEEVSTSKFLDKAPSTEEIFDSNKRTGDQVFLNCWGESTTIR